ncbi:hypothetical protein F5144DRAFT_576371 [Chaetomium tenue]|uniref:Uncharacterized protein n=1 Tax=Chaetomium tenue TaxID=1854479 RepID=A0ACB7P320_9PEZI|nr:hypothetical protein F5144DRAFT_576371 [Chaetomium globosum]
MADNASTKQQAPATAKNGASEEEQLEDMLYQLDQVHLQLRRLRSALPRMLEPLMVKQPSPQAAYAAYMQSVESTHKEVSSFQEAILRLQTDGVLNRARTGQKNLKGLKQWRASEHPDWADSDRKRRRIS